MRAMFSRDWGGALAVLVVLLFLIVAVSIPLIDPRESQLSAYDNDWNDISMFRHDIENLGYLPINVSVVSTTAASLTSIEDPWNKLYIAIGVERPYTFAEWRAIRNFILGGGKVLIADDFGYGNTILDYRGFTDDPAVSHLADRPEGQYRFSGKRFSDPRVDRNPQLIRLKVPIYEDLDYDVLLNDPSFFEENDGWDWNPWDLEDPTLARILANSSRDAWIDDDSDGVRDPGEVVGEFPVVIVQQDMLLISDPSIFTNDLYYRLDNRDFAHALINKLLPRGGTIIFDESIHLEPGLLSELDDVIVRPLTMVFGEDWPVYTGLLLLIISMAALGIGAKRGFRKFSRHMDRLHEPRRMEFGQSYNWLSDYYEVRGVLLQRMRYAYGLDPDDLKRLPPEIIAQLLGDQYLVQFVLQPLRVDPVALEAALGDIAGWEPPPHAEALVQRAEGFLANLPTDAPATWATPKAPPAWQGAAGQQAQQGYPQGYPQGTWPPQGATGTGQQQWVPPGAPRGPRGPGGGLR